MEKFIEYLKADTDQPISFIPGEISTITARDESITVIQFKTGAGIAIRRPYSDFKNDLKLFNVEIETIGSMEIPKRNSASKFI